MGRVVVLVVWMVCSRVLWVLGVVGVGRHVWMVGRHRVSVLPTVHPVMGRGVGRSLPTSPSFCCKNNIPYKTCHI